MSEATDTVTLTANDGGDIVVASIERPVTLKTDGDSWTITVFSEEAVSTTRTWKFPILRKATVTYPRESVVLSKDATTWATLTWGQTMVTIEAIPPTAPVYEPPATATATVESTSTTETSQSRTNTGSTSTDIPSPTPTGTPTPTPTVTSTSSDVINQGEAVGLAIGCFFAGGLVVSVFLALCRRRKKKPHAPEPKGSLELSPPADPQLVPHRNLKGDASSLEHAIGSYVDSYFPPEKIRQSRSRDHDANLKEWAAHEENWLELLVERETQPDACRMFIARVLSARIDRRGERSTTLLPVKAFDCYHSHLTKPQSSDYQCQIFPDSKEVCTNLTVNDTVAAETHYAAWREVQARGCWHQDNEDVRNQAVDNTVKAIQNALNPLRRLHRDHHPHEQIALRKLVVMAANYGRCLFFENQITELFWSDSHHGMEIFPGVRRIMTPDGRVEEIRQPSRK